MKTRLRTSLACSILFLTSALVVSCASSSDREVPGVICGTHITPDLARPLVTSTEDWHEYNRVDRDEAITAPCLVLSGEDVVLGFRFSWRDSATDLMYLAQNTGSVSHVTEPRTINFPYKTIVGTDGAISTTPCKTKGGKYFTLTLQVPQIPLTDQTHRKDIERFMRAYFPATLKTLGCR
ncbi:MULTISPECIES: hypothetical protein [unclassified Streptomyces]|uniref:hypothetical protein n=1 Tax=unclassified Streptomyces TaxID=2593676 RepID=UPI002E2AFA71|nr:hypothetical protein [Streptomyces sp. NBC_00228]